MFIRFDMIHERDRQTDGQTDRRTPHDGIDRAYAHHRAVKYLGMSESLFVTMLNHLDRDVQLPGWDLNPHTF